jgi:hypothetical protein
MSNAGYSRIPVTEMVFALPTDDWQMRLVPDDGHNGLPVKSPIYSKSQLINAVGFLRHENITGHHIFGRPRTCRYILIDDLDQDSLDCVIQDNLRPNVCVRTSKGNHQAWITLSKQEIDPVIATAAARILAKRYGGDLGSADAHHVGRLPGFTNRKDIYRTAKGFPFTGLHRPVYPGVPFGAAQVLVEAEGLVASMPSSPPYTLGASAPITDSITSINIDPNRSPMTPNEAIEIYEAELEYQAERNSWTLPIQKGDRSDADYAIAVGLSLRHRYEPDDIAAVLLHGSEKAAERGMDYVIRTVEAAL